MASSGTKDRPPHSRAAQRVPHWPAATFLLRGLQGLTTCLYPLSVVKTRQMALEGSQSGLKVLSHWAAFSVGGRKCAASGRRCLLHSAAPPACLLTMAAPAPSPCLDCGAGRLHHRTHGGGA